MAGTSTAPCVAKRLLLLAFGIPTGRLRHAPGSDPMTRPVETDPEVDGFLALLAARRAPRTVDAYRRDLADLAAFLGGSPTGAGPEQIEAWLADLRARGQAPSSVARRAAAARTFYRHLVALGRRADNPAAAVDLPRRRRRLPRSLSVREVERLIDAANGTTPRSLRDRALVELLYGAGLRVSEAVGLDLGGVDLDSRTVRCLGKGASCRSVRAVRKRCAATSRGGGRTSTAGDGPSSS